MPSASAVDVSFGSECAPRARMPWRMPWHPRRRPEMPRVPRTPRWARALLGVPLLAKLAGANALVAVAALGAEMLTPAPDVPLVLLAALGASFVVNLALVAVALHPLRELEETAGRVWRGDLEARVPRSPLADRDMARTGEALNLLLHRLTADRARLRRLATQIIEAQDEERSRIARELHDSAAQSLAALAMQLGALERDTADRALVARIALMRQLAADVLAEVRALSHAVHPRVLDDLGLPAALEWLARHAPAPEGVRVEVEAASGARGIPAAQASVLYRVAQEALGNALRHGAPARVRLVLAATDTSATLVVADDGRGFDVAAAEARRPGMGLFSMRERVGLVRGRLELASAPGAGTRVRATVPLAAGGA